MAPCRLGTPEPHRARPALFPTPALHAPLVMITFLALSGLVVIWDLQIVFWMRLSLLEVTQQSFEKGLEGISVLKKVSPPQQSSSFRPLLTPWSPASRDPPGHSTLDI